MLVSFFCPLCGNTDTSKAHLHDGCLGYEAVICKVCGTVQDHTGTHLPDHFCADIVEDIEKAKSFFADKNIFDEPKPRPRRQHAQHETNEPFEY